jgi:hypothetical protein
MGWLIWFSRCGMKVGVVSGLVCYPRLADAKPQMAIHKALAWWPESTRFASVIRHCTVNILQNWLSSTLMTHVVH